MDRLLEYIKDNLTIMKPAKGPIIALMIVTTVICTGFWNWYFSEVKDENSRLKSAIGVGTNPSVNPLIELTNDELKKKGMRVVKTIRSIDSYHQTITNELELKKRKREITEIQFTDLMRKEIQRASEELHEKIQVEALMVFDQLKTRVPNTAITQMGIGGLHIIPEDKRDYPISIHRLFSLSAMAIFNAPLLADNIEELIKALPE